MHNLTVLDNGLEIVTANADSARSVTVGTFVRTGSRQEKDGEFGVSHFLEHMMFKGTRKRPTSKHIAEAIEGVGGLFNAEAGKELTVFWAKLASHHLPLALDIISDIVLNSLYDPGEIEKERQVIIEELNMIRDAPAEWVHLLADEALWGEQALGRDVGGTPQSVTLLTKEQLLEFLASNYSPTNTVISVTGPVDHEQVVSDISKLLGGWNNGLAKDWPPAHIGPAEPKVVLRTRDTEQVHFCAVAAGLSYRDEDRFALGLANVILGEGMSSRLFMEIREVRGLAYDVHSYPSHYSDAGAHVMYAGVEPPNLATAVQAVFSEVDRLGQDVSAAELKRAKEFSKGRLLLTMEDTRSVAFWLGSQRSLLGEIMTVDEVTERIDSVSLDDVRRVVDMHLLRGDWRLAVVGPVSDHEALRELLPARA